MQLVPAHNRFKAQSGMVEIICRSAGVPHYTLHNHRITCENVVAGSIAGRNNGAHPGI
jgi:hypothetical protein